jgi:2-keto-3-deoxy-L-rhamnonate aldolase RhmA
LSQLPPQGIFIKTPHPLIVEILKKAGLDFAVIDAEHAPFDRGDIDAMMIAGRAANIPLLVRILDREAGTILSTLDLGAAGLLVPHVDSYEIARNVVKAARYRGGERGYSGGPRHAGYGTLPTGEVMTRGDRAQIIVQIEHPMALPDVPAMLADPDIAGIFIGRADLAIAMGYESTAAPEVEEFVVKLLAVPCDDSKIKGVLVGSVAERSRYRALGANWFLMGNDQGLLRQTVTSLMAEGRKSEAAS